MCKGCPQTPVNYVSGLYRGTGGGGGLRGGGARLAAPPRRGVCEGVCHIPVDPAERRTMMERCLGAGAIVRVRESPRTRTTECPPT